MNKSKNYFITAVGYSRRKSRKNSLFGVLFIANTLSLCLGVVYLFSDNPGVGWNIYGFLMILTLVGNLMIQLQTSPLKQFDFVYLLLFNSGMLLIPVLNTYSSAALMDYDSISKLSISIILSIYLLGAVVSLIRLSDSNRMNYFTDNFSKTASGSRFTKAFKKIVLLLYTLLLLSGIYISYDLLDKDGAGLTEVFIPQLALFFGLFFLGIACSILRLYPRNRKSVFSISVLLVGFIVFVICLLPLSSIPDLITDAKENYESAFGAATLEEIELLDKEFFKGNDSFKQIPFSIPGYFYGLPSGDYEVKENVQFYEGMNGVDKGIKLLFDVYTPSEGKSDLPGNNAVLIRIHGGGWTIGDKGSANFAQVNKYFASRGYIVFDIQYGLFNGKKFIEMVEVPENIIGNFTIDDMVRHIGIFTSYLADHHEEYHANLSSVFISGGSAIYISQIIIIRYLCTIWRDSCINTSRITLNGGRIREFNAE